MNNNNLEKILYIHGWGSNGNAQKAQLLKTMFPKYEIIAPTFDYASLLPNEVYEQLQYTINQGIKLIVGSSIGGFFALCCSKFSQVPTLLINPVVDIEQTFRRLAKSRGVQENEQYLFEKILANYLKFQTEVFKNIPLPNKKLNFALSTDDELLGSHELTKQYFANCGKIIELDNCGHVFLRFVELKDFIKGIM